MKLLNNFLSNFSVETNLAQTTVYEVGITQEQVISLQELISDYQAYASLSKQRIVLNLHFVLSWLIFSRLL